MKQGLHADPRPGHGTQMRYKSSHLSQGKNPSTQDVRTQLSVWGPGPQQTPQATQPLPKAHCQP